MTARSITLSALIAAGITFLACAVDEPTSPTAAQLGKGGTKGKTEALVVTNFTVEQFWPSDPIDRCPDALNPCNKLVFEYTGVLDSIVFHVAPNLEGKYLDPTIENSHVATGYWRTRATESLVPVSDGLVEAYWQGQWQPIYWETPMGPATRDTVELIPNLDLVEESDLAAEDHFVFGYSYIFGRECRLGGRLPYHDAVYTGWTSDKYAYVTLAVEAVTTPGKGKQPSTTQLEFTARTFKDADTSTTLHAYTEVLLTDPNGSKSMLYILSHGDVQTVFRTDPLTLSGCYEARVIGVDSYAGTAEFYDDRFYVWDRSKDPDGAAPLGVEFDAESGTITKTCAGGCGCPPQ
jgi:hypothetical protein